MLVFGWLRLQGGLGGYWRWGQFRGLAFGLGLFRSGWLRRDFGCRLRSLLAGRWRLGGLVLGLGLFRSGRCNGLPLGYGAA